MRRFYQSLRESRKNPRPGLYQGDPQPGLVEDFQAIMFEGRCRIVELGSEFDACRATTNDRDIHRHVPRWVSRHRSRNAQTMIQQLQSKAIGLVAVLEEEAVILYPGDTEVV
jgi:hypothetical protein